MGTDRLDTVRASYGSLVPPRARGGEIVAVDPGSPAAVAGLEPGDLVLTADGLALRDVIDWRWNADGPSVSVLVERTPRRFDARLTRDPGEDWGITFRSLVFDRLRTCANDCAFCFVSQLPKGLRPSLYLRDDDYRLSFLAGTFITLTNIDDADVRRIAGQRLSPLHVSLHAVSPQVRGGLLRCRGEDSALVRFDELAAAGIEFHVQIVLVPGVNDGGELARTLGWLAARGPAVASVGVVPLGYTGHQGRFASSYERAEDAGAVIESLRLWQARSRDTRDETWVQAADELYLAAGLPMPPAQDYDGYPQFENGIGMVRSFQDEWAEEAGASQPRGPDAPGSPPAADRSQTLSVAAPPSRSVLVTGELFAPVLGDLVAGLRPVAQQPRVLAVANRFLGGIVSVAGLLTAADLAAAIAEDAAATASRGEDVGRYLVPDVVLNDDGVTLDDVPEAELIARAAAPVTVVSSDAAGVLGALSR